MPGSECLHSAPPAHGACSLRSALTAARMAAKKATEAAFAQQRRELLAGAELPVLQRKPESEAQVAEGAAAITDSLRRTRQVLAAQLEHTAGNLELLGGCHRLCCWPC